jgi:Zn-dependent membrane protease YugP
MHPLAILIPAAALMFGPRLWVNHILKKHHRTDDNIRTTGGEVARALLDRYNLRTVRVEGTDIGDHYDPAARVVRLARDKLDRKTLTAVTTAAHEVGHALQHASGYGPFVMRTYLARAAEVTGRTGTVLLLATPLVALATRRPVPPVIITTTAVATIGAGVIARIAALPVELDASFRRALPLLLQDGYIRAGQERQARTILMACSLTYLASSLAGVLNIWPWLQHVPALAGITAPPESCNGRAPTRRI